MGCKHGVFLTTIPKALEKGALSGTELLNRARNLIPPEKKLSKPKKPFIEALNCLLDQKKIQIESYDMSLDHRERKQSFNPNGFIFSLVKTEPLDILFLINKVEKDESEGKKAFYELRKLFCKKVLEIELENQQKWESLLNGVIEREPSEDEILWFYAEQRILSEIGGESLVAKHYRKEQSCYTGEIEEMIQVKINDNRNNLAQIVDEHNGTSLFLLEIPDNEELNEYEIQLKAMDPKPESITKNYLFTNKKLTNEEFLTKIGFKKPIKRSHNCNDELFQEVFSYINSQEKGREALVDRLARGLSDRNNSKELLNELVYEASDEKESLINDYSLL